MAQLSVQSVTMAVLAVAIGLILIGSLLAPIATDVMTQLTTGGYEDGATWANLVGVTVVVSILGLIIVAINQYTRR